MTRRFDPMSDPTGRFAALINAMTPGEWSFYPKWWLGASIRAPRAKPLHDAPYVTVAETCDQSLGDSLPAQANAAGIVASVALARLMVSERAVEVMEEALVAEMMNRPSLRSLVRAAIAAILKEVEG
jgi:hypothetical protein